jgi:hypothetical protein
MLPGSPQPTFFRPGPATRNGLSLACNGSRFHGPHSRVDGPDLFLRSLTTSFTARSALLLHHRFRFAPSSAVSSRLARCRSACRSTGRFADLHSPSGLSPPSGSKRSTGFAARRSAFRIRPIPFRSPLPVLFQVRQRITVPGSLRFRRLAVPQTSWNLIHYAPQAVVRQCFFGAFQENFHKIYLYCFKPVTGTNT